MSISIQDHQQLRFEIRDDGAGFDPATQPRGAGLTNVYDRMAEVGGRLTVSSTPGSETRVAGAIRLG